MSEGVWPWIILLFLGAFHGLNPAMGWLFAVALGMQERQRSAVWRALLPLALGHLLSVGLAILIVLLAGWTFPLKEVKLAVAGLLILTGGYRFFRNRHPRWGGMRVGMVDLTVWSFLMASAHGAGLMVLPVFIGLRVPQAGSLHSGHMPLQGSGVLMGLGAVLVHGAGYLLVTALIAWVVFEKVGLGVLRSAWVNLDVIWAAALVMTGLLTLLF